MRGIVPASAALGAAPTLYIRPYCTGLPKRPTEPTDSPKARENLDEAVMAAQLAASEELVDI